MSQHNTQGRQGQGARRRYNKGGRSYGNDRRDSSGYRPKYRKEAPAKLSLWQRFLGLFGIRPSKNNKYAARDKAAAKTNTRVARNRQDRVSAPKQPVSNRRLYVGNLSYEATESDLEDVFKGIGEVNSVEIIYNPRTHKSKGYAFVEMKKMTPSVPWTFSTTSLSWAAICWSAEPMNARNNPVSPAKTAHPGKNRVPWRK